MPKVTLLILSDGALVDILVVTHVPLAAHTVALALIDYDLVRRECLLAGITAVRIAPSAGGNRSVLKEVENTILAIANTPCSCGRDG